MLIGRNRRHFFLIFLSPRVKLLTPDWSRGKILAPDRLSTLFPHLIAHFTVVCLVTWPWIGCEAGGDLVLIQTSLLLICNHPTTTKAEENTNKRVQGVPLA